MEQFKTLDQIFEPDERQLPWVVRDRTSGEWRRKTLDDHHQMIAGIELMEDVPELVHNTFTTARQLLLYSWYVYPFIVVAELQAYTSLEFALRWCIRDVRGCARWGLARCMKHAITQGWLRDEGVREGARARTSHTDFLEAIGLADKEGKLDESHPQAYIKLLSDIFPRARNELAHGSPRLEPGGYVTLDLVARLINQLYGDG